MSKSPPATSRRRLKYRRWVLYSVVAVFILVAMVGVLVGVLILNRQKEAREVEARQSNEIDEMTSTSNGKPVVLMDEGAEDATGPETPAAKPANSPTKKPSQPPPTDKPSKPSPTSTVEVTNAPASVPKVAAENVVSVESNFSTTAPSEFIKMIGTVTTSPTVAETDAPTPFSVVITEAPARRQLTAFPTQAPSELGVTTQPTRPSFQHLPVPASNPTIATFYVHGDIPYNDSQAVVLEQQMREVPEDAEFVVFVGDMRSAAPDKVCVKEEYEEIGAVFRLSRAPVFSTLGDNDWSDCPNQSEGLQLWRDEFVGFEGKYWTHPFDIKRHDNYPENFAFEHKGILFIGVNIIGGDVHDAVEWSTRLQSESDWTIGLIRSYHAAHPAVGRVVIFGHANPGSSHNRFFEPVKDFISDELLNELPIAYICGDKHEWFYEPNYRDQPAWLRIMVTGLGEEPLLKVTIEANGMYEDPVNAFEIDRRLRRRRHK